MQSAAAHDVDSQRSIEGGMNGLDKPLNDEPSPTTASSDGGDRQRLVGTSPNDAGDDGAGMSASPIVYDSAAASPETASQAGGGGGKWSKAAGGGLDGAGPTTSSQPSEANQKFMRGFGGFAVVLSLSILIATAAALQNGDVFSATALQAGGRLRVHYTVGFKSTKICAYGSCSKVDNDELYPAAGCGSIATDLKHAYGLAVWLIVASIIAMLVCCFAAVRSDLAVRVVFVVVALAATSSAFGALSSIGMAGTVVCDSYDARWDFIDVEKHGGTHGIIAASVLGTVLCLVSCGYAAAVRVVVAHRHAHQGDPASPNFEPKVVYQSPLTPSSAEDTTSGGSEAA